MPSRRALFFAGLALVALPLAAADRALVILEQAIEARASAIVLPTTAGGTLLVTRCTGCAPQSFVTTARTRYLATAAPITLAALRGAIGGAPHTGLTVFYDAHSREVTRVVASIAPAASATRPHDVRQEARR